MKEFWSAWIKKHPQVEATRYGHLHRYVATTWAGRPALIAPSTGHQIALEPGPLAHTLEPGGLLLHDWRPGSRLLTHYLPVERGRAQAYA